MLKKAVALGADQVATGHYARLVKKSSNGSSTYSLHRAAYGAKDQSYVLYHLQQNELKKILFPLGDGGFDPTCPKYFPSHANPTQIAPLLE